MKKIAYLILFLFSISILVSCSFLNKRNKNETNEEPKPYELNTQWTLETETCGGNVYSNQYGKYLYFIENYSDEIVKIAKIDLEKGQRCWTSQYVESEDFTEPVKCGNYIFLQGPEFVLEYENNSLYTKPIIYCFNDSDGTLAATITVGKADLEKYLNGIFCDALCPVSDKYLLWTNGRLNDDQTTEEGGIIKLDISQIDFSLPATQEQYIPLKQIYFVNRKIRTNLIENDGIIYFETWKNSGVENPDSIFGAINVETEELLWENKSTLMAGSGTNALYYLNDSENKLKNRLYSFEKYIGCYNALTGKKIWEIDDAALGSLVYNAGVFYDDGYFYYTSAETDDPNIMCMNAKTGENIWGYNIPKSGSLFTRPIITEGKMFVLSWGQGLWVFDAKTGAVLGCNDAIFSGWYTKNAFWNGNVIIFDFHNLSCKNATILAIKP